MKPSEALADNREAIRRIVEAARATNPRVCGSVARGEDTEKSDLDLLVDPMPGMTLFDIADIEKSLQRLLGVRVEVGTVEGLSEWIRDGILNDARPI